MTFDFRASQLRSSKIIASGSTGTNARFLIYPIDADGVPEHQGNIKQTIFNTSQIGTDVFVYISGSFGSTGIADSHGAVVFGGDTVFSGSGKFQTGLSGSLQRLSTGEPYLTSSNLTINTNSLGQIELTGSSPGPLYIPLCGYTTIDATMGLVQIGAIPFAFATASFDKTGFTTSFLIEMICLTGNGQLATFVLYDETTAANSNVLTFTSASPLYKFSTPTFHNGSNIYTATLQVSGSTTSDYAIIYNATLKVNWT